MKPRISFLPWLRLFLSLYALSAVAGHGAEISARWILQGLGEWNNPANWTNGIVPVHNSPVPYDVTIQMVPADNAYVQAAIDGNMTISRLTLGDVLYVYDSGSSVRRQFQVQNEFHWRGGSLSGWRADFHLYGDAFFEDNTVKTLDRECALFIHDWATWSEGTLAWRGYGNVTIESNALFNLSTGGTIGTSGSTDSASITNRGTIHMNAASETVNFYGSMGNSGFLDLQAGDMRFNRTFVNAGAIHIAPGSRLIIGENGSGIWQPFTFTGGGAIEFLGGQQLPVDVTFLCALKIAGNVGGPGNLVVSNALWQGGTLDGPGQTHLNGF